MLLVKDILEFWFEGVDDSLLIDQSRSPFNKWFKTNLTVDGVIQEKYTSLLDEAKNGQYDLWRETPEGSLALILLFDQFARNIYRGTQRAYETDFLAQTLALEVLQNQFDERLSLIQRVFIYMPLMHAEDLNLQKLSVQCFGKLIEESREKSSANTAYYQWHMKYAKKNLDTIEEFGYFPQRKKL